MTKIAAIMPCRGRAEQTVENARRLLATAGNGSAWRLYCVGAIPDVQPLKGQLDPAFVTILTVARESALTYWEALQATMFDTDASLLVNLANDLLPGRDWLARALAEYHCCFGKDGDGLMGFNDGIHESDHAPHFLISRRLLDHYGGWPVWYRHNFGDTELCLRAQQDGRYGKAPWALLYHDHWINGGQQDTVYAEGMASNNADWALFEERRAAGWPHVSQ